jgi:hypothetical protein
LLSLRENKRFSKNMPTAARDMAPKPLRQNETALELFLARRAVTPFLATPNFPQPQRATHTAHFHIREFTRGPFIPFREIMRVRKVFWPKIPSYQFRLDPAYPRMVVPLENMLFSRREITSGDA